MDKALIRPGRFDRHIQIGLPDENDREEIFKVLFKKYTVNYITPKELAKLTDGFSPAEMNTILNEAAINAAFQKRESIELDNLKWAMSTIRKS